MHDHQLICAMQMRRNWLFNPAAILGISQRLSPAPRAYEKLIAYF